MTFIVATLLSALAILVLAIGPRWSRSMEPGASRGARSTGFSESRPSAVSRSRTSGQSFAFVVAFGSKLRAVSVHVFGQRSDPHSPHYFDQAPLFSEGKLKPVWTTLEDIRADAARVYHPGAGGSRASDTSGPPPVPRSLQLWVASPRPCTGCTRARRRCRSLHCHVGDLRGERDVLRSLGAEVDRDPRCASGRVIIFSGLPSPSASVTDVGGRVVRARRSRPASRTHKIVADDLRCTPTFTRAASRTGARTSPRRPAVR